MAARLGREGGGQQVLSPDHHCTFTNTVIKNSSTIIITIILNIIITCICILLGCLCIRPLIVSGGCTSRRISSFGARLRRFLLRPRRTTMDPFAVQRRLCWWIVCVCACVFVRVFVTFCVFMVIYGDDDDNDVDDDDDEDETPQGSSSS